MKLKNGGPARITGRGLVLPAISEVMQTTEKSVHERRTDDEYKTTSNAIKFFHVTIPSD